MCVWQIDQQTDWLRPSEIFGMQGMLVLVKIMSGLVLAGNKQPKRRSRQCIFIYMGKVGTIWIL